jgi:hypothetical protein
LEGNAYLNASNDEFESDVVLTGPEFGEAEYLAHAHLSECLSRVRVGQDALARKLRQRLVELVLLSF